LLTPLSIFFSFFSALSDISSPAAPRNSSVFVLVSKTSITMVPTL
jgi:hypothetical protein